MKAEKTPGGYRVDMLVPRAVKFGFFSWLPEDGRCPECGAGKGGF